MSEQLQRIRDEYDAFLEIVETEAGALEGEAAVRLWRVVQEHREAELRVLDENGEPKAAA